MSKWICVNDRLPKKGREVIVRILEEPEWKGAPYTQYLDIGWRDPSYNYLSGWNTSHDLSKYGNITHWHKLPKKLPPLPL